MILIKNI